MGKTSANPRYNIVHCRLNDEEFCDATVLRRGKSMSAFILEAVQEKIQKEKEGVGVNRRI